MRRKIDRKIGIHLKRLSNLVADLRNKILNYGKRKGERTYLISKFISTSAEEQWIRFFVLNFEKEVKKKEKIVLVHKDSCREEEENP